MPTRLATALAVLLPAAAAAAAAQPSTEKISSAGARTWHAELSAGVELVPDDRYDGEGSRGGRALLALLAARWHAPESSVGASAGVFGLRRAGANDSEIGGGLPGWERHHDERSVSALGIAVAPDLTLRLGRGMALALGVGVAYVPVVRGREERTTTTDLEGTRTEHSTGTSSAFGWTGALSLRTRRLVIAQHAIVIPDLPPPISGGELFRPLTVGWRF